MLFLVTCASVGLSVPSALRPPPSGGAGITPIRRAYDLAAGGLFAAALRTSPGAVERAVFSSTALALLVDFGPSSERDLRRSLSASDAAVDGFIEASPSAVLVNNFVHNLGAEREEETRKKEAASARLAAAHRLHDGPARRARRGV